MSTIIDDARRFAIEMHDKFKHQRSNGEAYWHHPERVVATLQSHGVEDAVVAAAWIHDVAEDCAANEIECEELLKDIERRFGQAVATLAREVTNYFSPTSGATMEQKQKRLAEHAPYLSPGAKWIKLADRFDNISGMDGWSDEKRHRYATATLRLLEALRPTPPGADDLVEKIAAMARQRLA